MTTFYTADWHFMHNNAHTNNNRPYDSVEEMDEGSINRWNEQVTNDDTVVIIGDLAFKGVQKVRPLLEQLNGKKVWVKGNHDKWSVMRTMFAEGLVEEIHKVGYEDKLQKEVLFITHYPMEVGKRERMWSISGHIHYLENTHLNQINVGVDSPFVKSLNKEFGYMVTEEDLYKEIERRKQLLGWS